MLHKLKADLTQHSTAYLLIALLSGAMACGVFMLARLIAPARQAITPAPVTLVITLTPAPTDAYRCDQAPMPVVQPTTLNPTAVPATQIAAPIDRAGDPLPFLELPFPYNGGAVNGHDQRTVCPTATTTYTLRVKFQDDSIREYTATVTVQ